MSTRQTIKLHSDLETGIGYHLYTDLMEIDDIGNGPVHLELNGVCFEAVSGHIAGGGGVDVTIPMEWAEALGLIKKT